jgi:hypothetical protein
MLLVKLQFNLKPELFGLYFFKTKYLLNKCVMQIHKFNEFDKNKFTEILKKYFSTISDENYIKNYHPNFSESPENIFFLLTNKLYSSDYGSYFLVTHNDEYICSGGWLKYSQLENTALLLTRAYVNPSYRGKFYLAEFILPKCIEETKNYENKFITINQYNISLMKGFLRSGISNNWPSIYKKFNYIGIQNINYTDQFVFKYNG